jgi:PAT family beta-lactamase induction signal transducer AmpG
MTQDRHCPPNWVFAVLHMPYGVCNGFFTITLGFLLAHAGVSTQAIAGIVGLCLFPLTWSVVWAPMVDFTLSYRAWYVIGTAATGLGIALAGLLPPRGSSLLILDILAFATAVASTFTSQVTAAFAVHAEEGKKGDAAGWFMAGSIGGIGLGGGLGLWLAHHVTQLPWLAGLVLGLLCLSGCGALVMVREPAHAHRAPRLLFTIGNIWRDVLDLARSRTGVLAFVLLLLPMGTGAASNLWSAVAGDWKAGADLVALATGVAGGGFSVIGALAMGRLCDRFGAKTSYIVGAAAMGVVLLAMAAAPRSPAMFAVFTLAYALSNGAMYASFGAVMLEAIGTACAATKAPIMTCLTNIPILAITLSDGQAQTMFGSGGMLLSEAVISFAAIAVFIGFAAFTRPRPALAMS